MPRYWLAIVFCLLALTVFIFQANAFADETRVIQLKHRPAGEIIPLVRPLLGPDDALNGVDYRLIIRTSDRNFKEIGRVLAQLDVAHRQLRITVEQVTDKDATEKAQSLSGEASVGDKARIILPDKSAGNRGLTVRQDELRYTLNRRSTTSGDTSTQTIMALDGQRAYIRLGQSVPYVKKILSLSPHRVTLVQGIELQDVTTGFDVLPRVHGDKVRLEITPRLSTPSNSATGLVNFQELSTTVEANMGQWIDLGTVIGRRGEVQHAILESVDAESGAHHTVRLKVE